MIEYLTDIMENAKKLNSRFLIIKIINLCDDKSQKYVDTNANICFCWCDIRRLFTGFLKKYNNDNNINVNDEILIELYYKFENIEIPPKIILVERIIKLITLT